MPKEKSVPAIYYLEPIGVDGKCEATDVIRFCSDSCRSAWLAMPDVVEFMFGSISIVLEEGAPTPSYPNEADYPGVIVKGLDSGAVELEVCAHCCCDL